MRLESFALLAVINILQLSQRCVSGVAKTPFSTCSFFSAVQWNCMRCKNVTMRVHVGPLILIPDLDELFVDMLQQGGPVYMEK